MASAFKYIYKYITKMEEILLNTVLQNFPPGNLAPALVALPRIESSGKSFSLKDVLQDSVLWAVPKKRRTREKVLMRKFGVPKYVYKLILPKQNIVVCSVCGGYRESHRLCGTCYNRVMTETKEIQDKIQAELGLSPVEENVVVLYQGEKEENPEFWKGKRIVEMPKPRPSFFSRNLLQKSTQPDSDSKEVAEIPHYLEYK